MVIAGGTAPDGSGDVRTMTDEVRDPAGHFREVAGGSSDGTSTGAAIISQGDPLAGLVAARPGATTDNPSGDPESFGERAGEAISSAASAGEGLSGLATLGLIGTGVYAALKYLGGR